MAAITDRSAATDHHLGARGDGGHSSYLGLVSGCVGMTGLAGTSEAVGVVAVVVLFVLYNYSPMTTMI